MNLIQKGNIKFVMNGGWLETMYASIAIPHDAQRELQKFIT